MKRLRQLPQRKLNLFALSNDLKLTQPLFSRPFFFFFDLILKKKPLQSQQCAAGDSAAYARRNSTLDDVVIVSALRTPITKVRCFVCVCVS